MKFEWPSALPTELYSEPLHSAAADFAKQERTLPSREATPLFRATAMSGFGVEAVGVPWSYFDLGCVKTRR